MTQEQKDEKDFEIRCYLKNSLEKQGHIDTLIIDACIKECGVTFYNVEQILESFIEDDEVVELDGPLYVRRDINLFEKKEG